MSEGDARLTVRWSDHEARKPYARPFGVSFWSGNVSLGSVAVSGGDLLYYRQFQAAVLDLAGEFFSDPGVEASPEPQRAWLETLTGLLPAAPALTLIGESLFDDATGRHFRFKPAWPDREWAVFDAPTLLDYQEFQAALAHQTGRLYRHAALEALSDDAARQSRWLAELAGMVSSPETEAVAGTPWPWRPGGA